MILPLSVSISDFTTLVSPSAPALAWPDFRLPCRLGMAVGLLVTKIRTCCGMAVFISLYQPKRQIGLSSRDPALAEREWQEIKATLPAIVRVQVPADLTSLLRRSRQLAERWLLAQVVRTGAPPLGGR
jgi:hypothetical protein